MSTNFCCVVNLLKQLSKQIIITTLTPPKKNTCNKIKHHFSSRSPRISKSTSSLLVCESLEVATGSPGESTAFVDRANRNIALHNSATRLGSALYSLYMFRPARDTVNPPTCIKKDYTQCSKGVNWRQDNSVAGVGACTCKYVIGELNNSTESTTIRMSFKGPEIAITTADVLPIKYIAAMFKEKASSPLTNSVKLSANVSTDASKVAASKVKKPSTSSAAEGGAV